MNAQDRAQKIESYGSAYDQLVTALKQFPVEMWQYKPSPDRWSIHILIIHIADSEVNSYVRCRKAIAEPGSQVAAYDEPRWAKVLHYHDQNTDDMLELFKLLRGLSYKLIKTLPEATWSNTIEHPENGTMTLEDWLGVYERHIPEHVAQMQETYADWQEQR